ncbi:Flavin-dependent L-tryptophan oxidase RebO precursor [compost metagenome]
MQGLSFRSPLFGLLREAAQAATWAQDARVSRRQFLGRAARAGAAIGAGGLILTRPAGAQPAVVVPHRGGAPGRIAIVGAGIAGLRCAYALKQAGIRAEVYDAAERTGGRMLSREGLMGPGLVTELGGEFIDSAHCELMQLVGEFRLPLIDTLEDASAGFRKAALYFDGRLVGVQALAATLGPIARAIAADRARLPARIDYRHGHEAAALDRLSLAAYLDRLGVRGWIRAFLEAAYITEYGLDPDAQSALNLITMLGVDFSDTSAPLFGMSDERFKVRGGNQRITDALAERLDGQLHPRHRLEAIDAAGAGYRLSFAGPNEAAREVTADVVVLCLPFTTLRQVAMRVELPAIKQRAIAELGYGQCAKLMMGVTRRIWRDQCNVGFTFSDTGVQTGWDNSQLQPGVVGGFTVLAGGRAAQAIGQGPPDQQAARFAPILSAVYPGFEGVLSGRNARLHWPSMPFALGSYAAYKPGQWTTIRGAEGMPVGNLYFAGEHCSEAFQGFMNGAAATGREVAEALLARLAVAR